MAVVTLEHNLKKKFRKIQRFFLATIFFKNKTLQHVFFIKIGQAIFKKNHFLNFSFLLHNSQKNEFLGVSILS